MDRRRKALEAKNKKEINADIREGEIRLKNEYEVKKVEEVKRIDKDIELRLEEAAKGDKGSYKRSVDELKKLRNELKEKSNNQLDQELNARILTLREQVLQKWTQDAVNSDEDLVLKLMGGAPELDDALSQLKSQKEREEAELKARLEERRKRLKNKLKDEKAKIDEDLNSKDPIAEEELENKKNLILQQHNREANSRDVLMNPAGSIMMQPSIGPAGANGSVEQYQSAAQEQTSAKQR